MKKPQWIIAGVGIFLVLFLFIATQQQLFGTRKQTAIAAAAAPAASTFRIDQHIAHVKEHLKPEQVTRLSLLENSITRGDVSEQKLHVYHQLARFWQDTGRLAEPDEWFEPYAWYSGEAARLENSEKSLTFAAHLFLNNLRFEDDPAIKQWKALQAKDLFERSLKLNSANDSAQVGLGAVYLYGGITNNPMEGLSRIRSVVDKDSGNVYAQMTLGRASMETGQLDRAIQRFLTVVRLDPMNLEATVSLADAHEQKGDKPAAIEWYRRCLPLIKNA
ncbi:MAG TPA: tetratricopeptide repeat protein, partial [Chitinophagaceae bacterium]|nr:tetratricopeptide repeat protein [Chitinophagaceae bacterium]